MAVDERLFEIPEPVALAELLKRTCDFIRTYVVVSDAQLSTLALWVAHTYAVDACETTPYILATGPEKRCGKTRLIEVGEMLVHAPLNTTSISEAALFRAVAKSRPTLLFDEIDAVFGPKARDKEDLRSLLNAGYRKGANVLRCVGEGSKLEVKPFLVFCAKMFAGIGELPETVADRCIIIRMQRKTAAETVERFRRRLVEPHAKELRQHLAAWAQTNAERLRDARPDLPDKLSDRAQDSWEPLLAIADAAGGQWPQRARRAAEELSGFEVSEDPSLGVQLLRDVHTVFADRPEAKHVASTDLVNALLKMEESPWGGYSDPSFDQRYLAKRLKPYGIRSKTVRDGGTTIKGYARAQIEDAFAHWAPPTAPDENGSQTGPEPLPPHFERNIRNNRYATGFSADLASVTNGSCDGRENLKKPLYINDVTDVTDKTAPKGPGAVSDGEPAPDRAASKRPSETPQNLSIFARRERGDTL